MEDCDKTGAQTDLNLALTLLLSEWPKLYGVLVVLNAIGLSQCSR